MSIFIPTILATTEEKYKEDINKVLSVPELVQNWVQIDIMDNIFVPNLSVGVDVIGKYHIFDKTEAHLMVSDPIKWFEPLKDLGFKRVLFPVEVGNTSEIIKKARELGLEVGLTINPPTDINQVLEFIDQLNVVLVMSVNPGFQGQPFIPPYEKVRTVARMRKDNLLIEVDGGVSALVAKDLVASGVDILAVGSALFKGNIKENYQKLKDSLNV